ncbi:MAG: aromatic acid exporter family protein [Acholeplasmataceae bacterium]|nr:aromatic acid exporter family protein [Acholeplasmataceae bacterium]
MQTKIYLTIKITVGFIIAVLCSYFLKLPYFYTTGVITLLSLAPTRLKSYQIALIRFLNLLLGFLIASLIFYFSNFNLVGLTLFIIIFIPLSFLLKLEKGLSVSLVLISQIYLEKNLFYLLNASYIFIIGVGIALLLNLIMPKHYKLIATNKTLIDKEINHIIQTISLNQTPSFLNLDKLIKETFNLMETELENITKTTLKETFSYLKMRSEQISILKTIAKQLLPLEEITEKTIILEFLTTFKDQIGEDNYALNLSDELEQLLLFFQERPLPEKRALFEIRAQLYTVLLELQQFLNLKIAYHETKYQNE